MVLPSCYEGLSEPQLYSGFRLIIGLGILMDENANENAIVEPQLQPVHPQTGLRQYCNLLVILVLLFCCFIISLEALSRYLHSGWRIPIFLVIVGTLSIVYYLCVLKFIVLDRERSADALKWRWASAFSVLAIGTAYPEFLHTKKLPRMFLIFGWVIFGIHFMAAVIANWSYLKENEFGKKAIHPLPPDVAGPIHHDLL